MRKTLLNGLRIPADIREEYWQASLRKNNVSLLVICVIIFGVELYNIARVLFWSPSGLNTRNNRIYFGMYCVLLALAAVWMLLRRILGAAPPRVQWGAQYSMVLLLLLWHICLNAYDLMADPGGDTTVYTTAILALGILIQMPAIFSLLCIGLGYGSFFLAAAPAVGSGTMLNLAITSIVALGVSLTGSYHEVNDLRQRRELKRMNVQLQELAQRDPLTKLLNREALGYWAEQCLQQSVRAGAVALFIIDIDDFKTINDTYGHPYGDYVLKEAALKMQTVFHDAEKLGRIGGDEFAVVLSGCMDEDRAKVLGERLIREITDIRWHDRRVEVCCSVGICWSSQPDLTYDQLYREADQALYEAKSQGKGCCCVRELSQRMNRKAACTEAGKG